MNAMRLLHTVCHSVGAAVVLTMAAPCIAKIDFVKDVQPILEMNCVSCHSGEKQGDFDLTSRGTAFKTGSESSAIVPFNPEASALYKLTILPKDDESLMPPAKQGGPLDKKSIEVLRAWISEGANWPKDITLKTRAKRSAGTPNSDDLELVRRIHSLIVERAKTNSKFSDYSAKVPKTSAPYSMVAIKGGEFLMGSPQQEKGRDSNEGPQTRVKISPFWLGKYEVTWEIGR